MEQEAKTGEQEINLEEELPRESSEQKPEEQQIQEEPRKRKNVLRHTVRVQMPSDREPEQQYVISYERYFQEYLEENQLEDVQTPI